MIFFNDGTYEEEYEQINRNIIDVNVMNTSLIITEGGYGAIDDNGYKCLG